MLWLVDGVRINNRLYGATTPLDTLPAAMVERIEVLDGAQSLFYGTQAIAGAINIVTKEFTEDPNGHVSVGFDTNGGRHVDGFFSDTLGGHRIVVFGSSDRSDGFQPFPDEDYPPSATDRNRSYDVVTIGGKYAYDFSPALRFSTSYQHIDAKLDFASGARRLSAYNERREDILSAKIDYTPSNEIGFFLKGYYHWWYTYFTEFDTDLDNPGTLIEVSNHEFWGFTDYGVNALGEIFADRARVRILRRLRLSELSKEATSSSSSRNTLKSSMPCSVRSPRPRTCFRTCACRPASATTCRASARARPCGTSAAGGTSRRRCSCAARSARRSGCPRRKSCSPAIPPAIPIGSAIPTSSPNEAPTSTRRSAARSATICSTGKSSGSGATSRTSSTRSSIEDLEVDVFDNLPDTVEVRGVEAVIGANINQNLSGQLSFTFSSAEMEGKQIQRVPEQYGSLSLDYHPMDLPFGINVAARYVGDVYRTLGDLGDTPYGNYVVIDLGARVFLDAERHHRLDFNVHNLFDEEYSTRVDRVFGDEGAVCPQQSRLAADIPVPVHLRVLLSFDGRRPGSVPGRSIVPKPRKRF